MGGRRHLHIPSVSYGELKTIVKGYAHADKKISLTEASKLTGMSPLSVSNIRPIYP